MAQSLNFLCKIVYLKIISPQWNDVLTRGLDHYDQKKCRFFYTEHEKNINKVEGHLSPGLATKESKKLHRRCHKQL